MCGETDSRTHASEICIYVRLALLPPLLSSSLLRGAGGGACVLCVVAFWWGRLSSLLLMVYSISIHPGMTTEAGKRPPGHHIYIVAVAAVNNLLTRPALLVGPRSLNDYCPAGLFMQRRISSQNWKEESYALSLSYSIPRKESYPNFPPSCRTLRR